MFGAVAVALLLQGCGRTLPLQLRQLLLPDGGVVVIPNPPLDAGTRETPDAGPCFVSRVPSIAWQAHRSESVVCFGKTFSKNGDTGEYDFAAIPPEDDPLWVPHPAPAIDFTTPSRLCGTDGGDPLCPCRGGGDFTYFQTRFELGGPAKSLTLTVGDIDDGMRATLFNSKHPDGFTAGFAFLFTATTLDLSAETAAGRNRLVLTHVDDCCRDRRLTNCVLTLDGAQLVPCE
jgi:hypothetical protein